MEVWLWFLGLVTLYLGIALFKGIWRVFQEHDN
jgi:hypothetical protein